MKVNTDADRLHISFLYLRDFSTHFILHNICCKNLKSQAKWKLLRYMTNEFKYFNCCCCFRFFSGSNEAFLFWFLEAELSNNVFRILLDFKLFVRNVNLLLCWTYYKHYRSSEGFAHRMLCLFCTFYIVHITHECLVCTANGASEG